jgi:uncharacterized protein
MVRHGIDLGSPGVEAFCGKWRIAELAVFGSILRDDYRPDSDVDFVVTYESGVRPRFHALLDMEEELSALVDRLVDVVEREQVDRPHANPIWRQEIPITLETVYCGQRM